MRLPINCARLNASDLKMSMPSKCSHHAPANVAALADGILAGDRTVLAQGITLIESTAAKHRDSAAALLQRVLPHTGGALRVGLSGVPGSGKSTFIEALGLRLCQQGQRVAVLTVDPISSRSGGSILADKTRMAGLSHHANAFIRSSPAGAWLGGVAARTREALLLCEAAGYQVVLIETVGVGQSESEVCSMTDFFLLLQMTGAGDELQGIKKGVIELADAIVVTKADGANRLRAELAQSEYNQVLSLLHPAPSIWQPQALTCSALTGEGIDAVWQLILKCKRQRTRSGVFESRRREQNVDWFRSLMQQQIIADFNLQHASQIKSVAAQVRCGQLSVALALQQLFDI